MADEIVPSQEVSYSLIDELVGCTRMPKAVRNGPVSLPFCNIIPEVRHDRSVQVLNLAIGLQMICSSGQMFSAQT